MLGKVNGRIKVIVEFANRVGQGRQEKGHGRIYKPCLFTVRDRRKVMVEFTNNLSVVGQSERRGQGHGRIYKPCWSKRKTGAGHSRI
jgi:hypothetical protein